MENIKLGDRVKVLGKNTEGEVAFVGETHFSDGIWLGIILDEPKGRNNGTVDGGCYFKCPWNYGIFVRSCQVEKETVNSAESSDKINTVSSKITCPNYLSASSKLKTDKHSCRVKSVDHVQNLKSRLKIAENKIIEEDYESLIKEKDEELKNIRDENTNLKIRLKNNELSLQDTLQKHEKAMDDIKNLKDEIDLKKEHINVYKWHLKLLKMRQCKHDKDVDSFKTPNKEDNKKSNGKKEAGGSNLIKDIDDINFSGDEFDSESLKALASMQRIVELEEENRVMIRGLIELRQFLKVNCKPKFANLDISNAVNQHRQKGKRGNTGSFSESSLFSLSGKTNESSVEESAQIKEYGDMLREMTKFNEIMKEKGKSFCNDDNMLQSLNEIEQQSSIDVDANTNLDISDLQKDFGKNFKTLNFNIDDFKNYYEAPQNQHSEQILKQPSKRKSKTSAHFANEKNTPEFKNIAPNAGNVRQCLSVIPHKQQDLPFEKSSYPPPSIAKSVDQPVASSSSDNLLNLAIQSIGDGAFVKPTRNSSKRKMCFPARVHQRQESGNNK